MSSEKFRAERILAIEGYKKNPALVKAANDFLLETIRGRYSYNFDWLSRPIIQYPQDIVAMQELVWSVKPDLIIETGVAHGGSLILSASLLAMLDYCDAVEKGEVLDPRSTRRRVIGIDIDIRPHNRAAIEAHPMAHRIDLIQGSSLEKDIVATVSEMAKQYRRTMVCLDSNHTHEHVLAELEAYAPLTSKGSYCCVFDTVIEDLPSEMYSDRPWDRSNNPKTAVREYLQRLEQETRLGSDGQALNFALDRAVEDKLLVTVAPNGYLKRL
jgi:cephalosporin hydroxylase